MRGTQQLRCGLWRGLLGAAILALAEVASFAVITGPADAQFFSNSPPRPRPQRSGGFFDNLFGPSTRQQYYAPDPGPQYQSQSYDSSRAPAARKPDKDAPPPTTSIVVLGDGMADWLASGLEDAFADAPEIGIVRKNRQNSGLLHYDQKGDLDWWHVARDLLAPEKPNYVVMMLGVSDRQNIRERDLAKAAEKAAEKKEADKKKEQPDAADKSASQAGEGDSIIAPEPQGSRSANGIIEFRTDRWATIYSKRIDDTVAALKSKGVPVFWVGLPSIRGPKSTADAVYLNDLYKARAEKAGAIYIDVWDGFVDEGGKYTTYGPDFEGQRRALRSGDGVYFTKAGARKLAHYVERELRRYMSNRGPIALPMGTMSPVPADGKSAVRPLAGPVVPLTVTPANSEELLGGSSGSPGLNDPTATRVLVKGEAVPAPAGRADDFVWPPGSARPAAATPPVATAPTASVPVAARTPAPTQAVAPVAAPTAYTEPPSAAPKPAEPPKQTEKPKGQRAVDNRPRPQAPPQTAAAPRPPQPVAPQRPRSGPFDLFR